MKQINKDNLKTKLEGRNLRPSTEQFEKILENLEDRDFIEIEENDLTYLP